MRKKIFATMDTTKREMVVKLSKEDQDIFCSSKDGIIFPVSGAWGNKGWTTINLDAVDAPLFKAVLTTAYCTVVPKKLAAFYLDK